MALSIFDNKSVMPTDKDVEKVLPQKFSLWNKIKEYVLEKYPDATEQWNYSGKPYN